MRSEQPYLHDLVTCVDAPSIVLSDRDGQIRPGGVQGWFRDDRRLLDTLTVRVGGEEPTHLADTTHGSGMAAFTAVLRGLGDRSVDPTVTVRRRREVTHQRLVETITISSAAREDVEVALEVGVGADFAPMQAVRTGRPTERADPTATKGGFVWTQPDSGTLSVTAEPSPDTVATQASSLHWRRPLATGEQLVIVLECATTVPADAEFAGTNALPWKTPRIDAADPQLGAVVAQGLDDLRGLLLADTRGGDAFVSAGSPWYLTLFGRDSLWAARMLLPLGTELALSTLRALARRQGSRDDPGTEEQPGKIVHEVRSDTQVIRGLLLPPRYYGTVDATPLFVVVLAEAWRWGADPTEVQRLLPHARACLEWVERQAIEGFLSYVDTTGRGLANQGWKDSADAICWSDGRLAEPPIALSEVQACAYQAAVLGADLLEAFGQGDPGHWRDWAGRLAARFRERFWVEDDRGPYPAVALDGHGRPVDSVASNMGHLLGTGLLDGGEADVVAYRLRGDDMDSGFGLRTLSSRNPHYSPLSYHCGGVWPHDTTIAVHGLCREGYRHQAVALLRGLLVAASGFGHRLPELYAGDSAADTSGPAPYPSACRPQAWAAAAPLWAIVAVLGIDVDVPRGVVRVPAQLATDLGPLKVQGITAGGCGLDVEVDVEGRLVVTSQQPGIEIRTIGAVARFAMADRSEPGHFSG